MERPKVVLITGASTGIGRAAAIEMRGRGWRVFATVRRTSDVVELTKLGRGLIEPLMMDVTDEESVKRAIALISERAGRLDALVNNAGINIAAPLELLTTKQLQQQFEVNLFGVHRVTQAALPLLRQSQGRIVNISSLAGEVTLPFYGPYCASKHALEAMSDALRLELFGQVKVIVIQPGIIKTAIWDKAIHASLPSGEHYPKAEVERLSKRFYQVGQSGIEPEKVAVAIGNALELPWPFARWIVSREPAIFISLLQLFPTFILDRIKLRWLSA